MKLKGLMLACLLFVVQYADAQFKLTGKISSYTGQELKINIPVVFGFHRENSTVIPVAKDGTFSIELPIKQAKFGDLIYQRRFYTLLLHPNKALELIINESDSSMTIAKGNAAAENKVMQAVDVEEYPFFLANEGKAYSNLNYQALKAQVVQPYFAKRDEKIHLVQQSKIADQDKSLIQLELQSIAYNYLSDMAIAGARNAASIDSLLTEMFAQSNPKQSTQSAGPQFYAYISNYIRHLQNMGIKAARANQVSAKEPMPYIGISMDSAKKMEGKVSKPYWHFNIAYRNLPSPIVEQYAYQLVENALNYKELRQMEEMAQAFQARFPTSRYLAEVSRKQSILKSLLAANANNADIKIVAGFEKINSIYDVVKPFKGKVVYLDVWGTWCGPCKEELAFNPALKAKFKDKDVAFLYLDMDEEDKDTTWREFIKVNALTGVHFRKNRKTIVPFWKELLENATDKDEYYPQYFIFDRTGKLVVAKANRPSSGSELYAQLEKYLSR
ncbi:MAG: TlpA disulfide reductase family protein [Pedobacter sp.]|nr:TlpA disulfide reductase family protein [Pedobacter sp.]MDQ8054579.1 TlpA disulfide reductase family protein [Pedobacter sp.]